jgi:stearoyl-CoA desaturase (delta-9 desaturase)
MSLPFTQLRRNRFFYFYYDGFYAVVCALALLALRHWPRAALIETWDWRYLLFFPIACHLQILCSVFIHNATHNNFPRAINRLVGELCGLFVVTRFASWEVIHQRHHRFTDDEDKDPHSVMSSYWKFTWFMVVNVERQLQQQFYELYGDTKTNRRWELARAALSFTTMTLLVSCWYNLLGFYAFFVFFLPAAVVGILHLAHFNWSTHNGFSKRNDFRPVNLDHGYYWIGNRLWHGIYFHANHHKRANLFNPMQMRDSLPIDPAE